LEAGESDFIGTSGKKDLPRQTTAGRHRDTESTETAKRGSFVKGCR